MDYRQSECSAEIVNKVFFGGCHNQYKNNLKPTSWHSIVMPTPVPTNGQLNGGGFCDCTEGFTSSASGSNWRSAFNGNQELWLGNDANMLTFQTFATGSVIDFGKCLNVGFKNVAARRQWHGTFGWNVNDSCARTQSIAPSQVKYLTLTVGASYETAGYGSTYAWTYTDIDDPTTWVYTSQDPYTAYLDSGEASVTKSVDATTGVTSESGTNTSTEYTYVDDEGFYPFGLIKSISNGVGSLYDNSSGDATTPINYGGTSYIDRNVTATPYCNSDIPDVGNAIAIWNEIVPVDYQITDYPGTVDGYSASQSYTYPNVTDYGATLVGVDFTSTIGISVSRTETAYNYSVSYNINYFDDGDGFGQITGAFSGTHGLSDANYASVIINDCETLMGNWDLTDNAAYPWRTDANTSYAPLVTRREIQSNVSPVPVSVLSVQDWTSPLTDQYGTASFVDGWTPTYGGRSWFDPNAYWWHWKDADHIGTWADELKTVGFDGAEIGNPHPQGAGAGDWFDFYYLDKHFCQMEGDGCVGPPWELFDYAGGGSLADSVISNSGTESGDQFINFLPFCSTHWVDNVSAHSLSRGAMRTSGVVGSDALWTVKWAETRTPIPSQNFFRPCGADRVLIDETTGRNIQDGNIMDGELVGLDGDSIVLVSGQGIYNGCSQTDNGDGTFTLTIGTLIANLPTDFYRPIAGAVAGFVRFPNAWAICGRQGLTIATGYSGSLTGSVVTFEAPQTNLRTGDSLNLFDRTMTLSATSASVYRNSDTAFFINTPCSGSITKSVFAMSAGAPDYHWFDSSEKFQFRYGYWHTSERDPSFSYSSSCQPNCLPYSNCSEQVFCFSPNDEDFDNGFTTWFADTFQADGIYGAYQQANIEFQMPDLLFQKPLAPLTEDELGGDDDDGALVYASVTPEDGTCPADTFSDTGIPILYYHQPNVEALCSMPDGAPALPDGIIIPPLVAPPLAGVVGYEFHTYTQPFTNYLNSQANCNDECRFNYYGC